MDGRAFSEHSSHCLTKQMLKCASDTCFQLKRYDYLLLLDWSRVVRRQHLPSSRWLQLAVDVSFVFVDIEDAYGLVNNASTPGMLVEQVDGLDGLDERI